MAQGRPEHIQLTIFEIKGRIANLSIILKTLEELYPLPTVTPKIDDTPKQTRQTKRTRRRSGNMAETDLPKGVGLSRPLKSGEKRYRAQFYDKNQKKNINLGASFQTPEDAAEAIEKYKAEQFLDENPSTKKTWICTHCKETMQLPVKPVVCLHCRGASFEEVIGESKKFTP